ncbi:uncharacterized protein LOC110613327 isoform X5 [Manihot esculenta]|uniref:uncharacterized protein LOC110613327 isoform X5 n=1 Tax=Manihot esculenta TaxID=3983 RepID=UPI001CC7274D|nr:uncharacterized protein LOC110613327 isoform X5 [Manihot esculenta]
METIGVSVCSWRPSLPPQSPPNLKRFRVSSSSSPLAFTPTRENTLSLIHNSGVIACLRANSAELAFEAASAALRGGISVLEIVMSTPGVFQVLQQLVQEHPTVALGVGTLLNVEDAIKAKRAGAKFLMSPAMVMGIVDVIQDGEILYIPGAMTPTECLPLFNSCIGDRTHIAVSYTVLINGDFEPFSCYHFNRNLFLQILSAYDAGSKIVKGKEAVLRFDAHQTRRTEDY